MEHEILYSPSYSLLKISLRQGEAVCAEAGAMVSMSSCIEIKTAAKGGIFGALKRSVLGGESFFVNTFRAADSGEVTFAPTLPGDIHALELKGQSYYAQSGAYIASSPDIQVDTKWGGAKTFFSREGLFLLKMSGAGSRGVEIDSFQRRRLSLRANRTGQDFYTNQKCRCFPYLADSSNSKERIEQ